MLGTLQRVSDFRLNGIAELTPSELRDLEAASSSLQLLMSDSYLYMLVVWNFEELMILLRNYLATYTEKDATLFVQKPINVNVNRCFLNFLSSTRSYLDFMETLLKRRFKNDPNMYEYFRTSTNEEHANSFSYRFMYKLRDYSQHCGFPINHISWGKEYTNKKDKEITSYIKLIVDRDDILEDFNWKKLKAELQKQPEKIEALHHAISFMDSLKKIHIKTLKLMFESLTDDAHTVMSFAQRIEKQAQGLVPLVFSVDDTPEGGKVVNQWEIPVNLASAIIKDDFDSVFRMRE